MSFQEFWVSGSRLYFERDPDNDGNTFPMEDLGTVKTVSPAIAPERLTLEDSDGGLKVLVDSRLSKIEESYEVTTHNFSPKNLARLFMSNSPAAFTQTAEEVAIAHSFHPGSLVKIKDALGTALFMLAAVGGVYSGAVETKVITAITKLTKKIKVTGDHTAEAGLAAGKSIIVQRAGLANIANSRSYTVVSTALVDAGANTEITVAEEPAANETAITGSLTIENGGTIYEQDADWEVVSLDRGIVRAIDGGAISAITSLTVLFSKKAITGDRLLVPQGLDGLLEGKMYLVWGREQNAKQTVREARCTIVPSSVNVADDAYSEMTFTVTVISDLTADEPAGRVLAFKGDLPDVS